MHSKTVSDTSILRQFQGPFLFTETFLFREFCFKISTKANRAFHAGTGVLGLAYTSGGELDKHFIALKIIVNIAELKTQLCVQMVNLLEIWLEREPAGTEFFCDRM